MPFRSKRPCSVAGCKNLTSERWCEQHKANKHISRSYDDRRGSSSSRGYTNDWRKLRLVALRRDDWLCQECLKEGRPTPAVDVDHVVSIVKAPELRLVLENLNSLCTYHHRKKSIEEDGAFGRPIKKING